MLKSWSAEAVLLEDKIQVRILNRRSAANAPGCSFVMNPAPFLPLHSLLNYSRICLARPGVATLPIRGAPNPPILRLLISLNQQPDFTAVPNGQPWRILRMNVLLKLPEQHHAGQKHQQGEDG